MPFTNRYNNPVTIGDRTAMAGTYARASARWKSRAANTRCAGMLPALLISVPDAPDQNRMRATAEMQKALCCDVPSW